MLFDPKHQTSLDRLADDLRLAPAPTRGLFSRITRSSGQRFQLLNKAGKTAQLNQLIEAGAWIDATLSLLALELPAWKVRRLAHDDGEWICSLSREPNLPAEIDDTADAHHEVMALAILGAFLEARRRAEAEASVLPTAVPQVKSSTGTAICCDNFA